VTHGGEAGKEFNQWAIPGRMGTSVLNPVFWVPMIAPTSYRARTTVGGRSTHSKAVLVQLVWLIIISSLVLWETGARREEQEAESKRIMVQDQPGQIIHETLP
jgi:hypothetical protein